MYSCCSQQVYALINILNRHTLNNQRTLRPDRNNPLRPKRRPGILFQSDYRYALSGPDQGQIAIIDTNQNITGPAAARCCIGMQLRVSAWTDQDRVTAGGCIYSILDHDKIPAAIALDGPCGRRGAGGHE